MDRAIALGPCSPFFIVSCIEASLDYYVGVLGFDCRFRSGDTPPTFAIVGRDSAQFMLKSLSEEVGPLPNRARHPWARWDAFVFLEEPDRLEAELRTRASMQGQSTQHTDDGLHGFELADPDGYVCFFGHPVADDV